MSVSWDFSTGHNMPRGWIRFALAFNLTSPHYIDFPRCANTGRILETWCVDIENIDYVHWHCLTKLVDRAFWDFLGGYGLWHFQHSYLFLVRTMSVSLSSLGLVHYTFYFYFSSFKWLSWYLHITFYTFLFLWYSWFPLGQACGKYFLFLFSLFSFLFFHPLFLKNLLKFLYSLVYRTV